MKFSNLNVSFPEDGNRIQYRQCMWQEFDVNASAPGLSEDDNVTTGAKRERRRDIHAVCSPSTSP
jgi:hypothetical protein